MPMIVFVETSTALVRITTFVVQRRAGAIPSRVRVASSTRNLTTMASGFIALGMFVLRLIVIHVVNASADATSW
jgi:hypothetical protein